MSENTETERGLSSSDLQWICRCTLQTAFPSFRNVEVRASFYPYIGLTHTIRRKGGAWVVRISDHCSRAPRIVLEAITLILGCKVMRRVPPAGMLRAYERFRRDPAIVEAVEARRRRRGRKIIGSSHGAHHSLTEIYREVNRNFFKEEVDIRKLGWGSRCSWGRLGHYDPTHHTITISPVLDSPKVPRFVVAYIVYHEMLHTLFGGEDPGSGRKRHHPPEFRSAERAYPDYQASKRFLSAFCRRRGK